MLPIGGTGRFVSLNTSTTFTINFNTVAIPNLQLGRLTAGTSQTVTINGTTPTIGNLFISNGSTGASVILSNTAITITSSLDCVLGPLTNNTGQITFSGTCTIRSQAASATISNGFNVPSGSTLQMVGNVYLATGTVTVASTAVDNADDNIFMGLVPSNAVILDVEFLCDDLDSHATPTLAANIGLVYSGIGHNDKSKVLGDAADVDVFGTAVTTFQAAKTTWTSLRFEADAIGDVTKTAWEAAGLASDPGGYFAVVVDVSNQAATAAGGDIVMKVTFI
jgi:hypothetical protein